MSPQRRTSDWSSGNLASPLSFVELMALERLDTTQTSDRDHEPEKIERFRSLAAPFPPAEGTRSFGGHVFAQSAYAASKTVGKGFVVHDMTGSFIRGGRLDVPYVYTVRHIRDGYMYCTRAVDARQEGKICFSCLCSFKRDEKQRTFHHQPSTAQERFRSILSAKRPEDQPISPSVDADWWIENVKEGNITEREFPGLDVRKVDMKDYNQPRDIQEHPEKYRQLGQYRLKGSPDQDPTATLVQIKEREQTGEYDNLYACAHMYSSDKNSLLLIPRALGIKQWSEMASLTLMVVLHQHGEALRMIDWEAASSADGSSVPMKWFVQEGWTPQSAENRAVHESHLWSPDGTLVATSMQDSMLRLRKPGRAGNL
ncbi:hypothetical protein NUU61_006513 [Penicillium alfredii]|uniref:Acyl-CoA thioesterase-like N-terminal HotDog domain-containing protein n=1 Tax=Penicillium alfredii TaxID=1506179 RepID=A0A9W9F0Z2_9EURO|nr:uncharacterized protein NUU61_006513 [Penicillium alfredii]KAJ5091643.1 hypothetical protein NUU61_006513 [Penicillium alfredii]